MSETDSSRTDGIDRAVKTFGIDPDETLQLTAVGYDGSVRQIGSVHNAGELALVPTHALVPSLPNADVGDNLNVEELKIVGDTVTIGPEDSMSVMLDIDAPGEPIVSYHYPGVYGLLHIPFKR